MEPGLLWGRLWPRAAGWGAVHGKRTLDRTVPKKLLARTQLWPQRRCWSFLHTSHRYFSHQSSHRKKGDKGRVHRELWQKNFERLQRHKSQSKCSKGNVSDCAWEQQWALRTLLMLFLSPLLPAQMAPCGSQVGEAATRAAWRSITQGSGARSATMAGRSSTRRWFAGSWDLSKITWYWISDSITWPWWQTIM